MAQKMNLNKLYFNERISDVMDENKSDLYIGLYDSTSDDSKKGPRSNYQRDFDRIIFSSSFRRLQNKTQVFPLPGSKFVHNRLTHSLEVSSVGRSLGVLVGDFITNNFETQLTTKSKQFYKQDLSLVIAAACLCHDIGNPPFGHSGEDSISQYFKQKFKNDPEFEKKFSRQEQSDLINFEGNSNSIRCLVQNQAGKSQYGLNLTCSTLSAILKYPCPSSAIDKSETDLKRHKFGYLLSENEIFLKIANHTGMMKDQKFEGVYYRHPFVWLVEAADDICYNIIDLEDAHRLKIISFEKCHCFLFGLIKDLKKYLKPDEFKSIEGNYSKIDKKTDENDMISYLRAKAINTLIMASFEKYKDNFDKVLDGSLNISLYELVKNESQQLKDISELSKEKIYKYKSVIEIQNAGYNVMYELLDHFIQPILKDKPEKVDLIKLELLPNQFKNTDGTPYEKTLSVIDYISGMTDNYASELYRKIKGIEMELTN